jgi:hypothetical protein
LSQNPIYKDLASGYQLSAGQCEYATDIVFRNQADLQAIYENLASSTSADYRLKRFAAICPIAPAARCHACSNISFSAVKRQTLLKRLGTSDRRRTLSRVLKK